ncbi:MAG: ABC transporter substrate-binding protein, partial [Candidatus Rokubacteria bacterium]|nr:ABC transporter substrate-binding protein [Candidatus Rokubacteria bacterium]
MRRFLSLLLFLFAFLLAGVRDAEPGELRIGLPRVPAILDPATTQDDADRFLYPQIFETLVRFRDGGTEIEPGLATSWQPSRDGLTWSFRLRTNVRFHDGTVLIADHVVLALERHIVPDHPLRPNPPAPWTKALSGGLGIIRGVRRMDPATV